jgi:general secretion pathway protein K
MSARRHERGAALLTAMIIVTLIASLAAGMVWQQYRAVQTEAADRARAQSAWILQGALDWARLILKEDAKGNRNKPVDHLGEPWAVPLAEARLSTFLAADSSAASNDEGPEAFLSGSIEDAQSRYNLRALLGGTQVPELEQRVLERLCSQVNAPPGTAAVIINGPGCTAAPAPPPSSSMACGPPFRHPPVARAARPAARPPPKAGHCSLPASTSSPGSAWTPTRSSGWIPMSCCCPSSRRST